VAAEVLRTAQKMSRASLAASAPDSGSDNLTRGSGGKARMPQLLCVTPAPGSDQKQVAGSNDEMDALVFGAD
jgi:hypothetical protein